jgi:hypothetical protein
MNRTKLNQIPELSKPSMKTHTFLYPLTKQVVRNCRIVNDRLGDLIVTYTGKKVKGTNSQDPIDEQFKVDICSVTLNGNEIPSAILTYTELYQELEEAAQNNFWWLQTLDEDIPLENTPTYFTQKQSA